MREDGERGARARVLAALVALSIGWALWRSVAPWRSEVPIGNRLAADPKQSERVVSGGGQSQEGSSPLSFGARRALGLPADLNGLTADDFATLPGIGPRLAERIVEARRRRGGFGSVDDLGEVKGIGPAKLATLRAALEPPTR